MLRFLRSTWYRVATLVVIALAGVVCAGCRPTARLGVSEVPAGARISGERYEVTCADAKDATCDIKLEATLTNPTDARIGGDVVVKTFDGDEITIEPKPPLTRDADEAHAREPISIAAGESHDLSYGATLRMTGKPSLWMETPMIVARHPYLSSGRFTAFYHVFLDSGPDDAGSRGTSAEAHVPSSWSYGPIDVGGWSVAERDGVRVATVANKDTAHLSLEVPGKGFHNGGPIVGLGGVTTFENGDARFAFDIGYEVAIPEWLIESAHFDYDPRRTAIAPMIEWGFIPSTLVLPAFAIGAGMPIVVSGQGTLGVRETFSVQLPPRYFDLMFRMVTLGLEQGPATGIGVVAYFDEYPGLPAQVRTLMTLSL